MGESNKIHPGKKFCCAFYTERSAKSVFRAHPLNSHFWAIFELFSPGILRVFNNEILERETLSSAKTPKQI
jgi:hypothetical protein